MAKEKTDNTVEQIKTGSFERYLSLTGAGVIAGSRAASHLLVNALAPKQKRQQRRRQMMTRQTAFLVEELGKLKGSVVKIGQMIALFGEHVLPPEVTSGLRQLEEQTTPVAWPVMQQVLIEQLGEQRVAELDIDPIALAAASLGQVHRATRKSDQRQLCLKIQYPGVADTIDSDLAAVTTLLRLTNLISQGEEFKQWLEEIRSMLKREVDYLQEAATTRHFRRLLADDPRFVVPEIIDSLSSERVITMSWEAGYAVNTATVAALPQARRNALGKNFLELFLREIFVWSELQSDPNFGNYRIRPKTQKGEIDKIVLLDFGAVKPFPDSFIKPLKAMIEGGFTENHPQIIDGAIALNMLRSDYPSQIKESFALLCIAMLEPLNHDASKLPAGALNKNNCYRWAHSNLPRRIARQAADAAYNRYFNLPSAEFTFLSRKSLGVYNFIATLDAEFNGREILSTFLQET